VLGIATRIVPAPTPFMLTGPGSSVELVRLVADRGARSVLVVTDGVPERAIVPTAWATKAGSSPASSSAASRFAAAASMSSR
jgi:hypothetical protein